MSNEQKLAGIYRSPETGGVVAIMRGDDGLPNALEISDLSLAQSRALQKIIDKEITPDDFEGTDWYIDVSPEDRDAFPQGGGNADPKQTGDGAGTGEGTGDGAGDGDGDGDGDQGDPNDGEGSPEAELPERPSEQDIMHNVDGMLPDDMPIEHPLGQEIWAMLKPNVVHHDAAAQYAVAVGVTNLVLDYVDATTAALESKLADVARKAGKGGNGGGVTIKVKGRAETKKLDGLIHNQFDKVLRIVSAGVPAMLVGPPGTGKTFMAQQICDALGINYVLQSFTPQTTESAIKGFMGPNGDYVVSPFRTVFDAAYGKPGAYILDEGDNCSPPVMTGLNSAMANRYMQFPDAGVHAADEFQFIMTANTWGTGPTAEFSGRAKLDPATLNWFAKIYIGTDESIEDQIIQSMLGDKKGEDLLKKVRHVRTAVEALGIKHFVTMRDSINCATLMQPGDGAFTTLEALQVTCLGPLTDDQQAKVKAYRA